MTLMFKERQLVTPGELLAEGDYLSGDNTYKEDERIYATIIGIANSSGRTVYVTALKGCYIPRVGDLVIGKVIDVSLGGWIVDINAPYNAILYATDTLGRSYNPRRDELTRVFDVGDLILAKVIIYDRTRDPVLSVRKTGFGKISHGHVLTITPTKIPRLIGKKGSMITMIKNETGCHITIGQNGRVLVVGRKPEDEALAILAIRTVEREAHTSGLTDRVHELLKEEKAKRGV